MRYADSVVDLIGDTPMVALRSVLTTGPQQNQHSGSLVLAKLEYLNPGGSVYSGGSGRPYLVKAPRSLMR